MNYFRVNNSAQKIEQKSYNRYERKHEYVYDGFKTIASCVFIDIVLNVYASQVDQIVPSFILAYHIIDIFVFHLFFDWFILDETLRVFDLVQFFLFALSHKIVL